MRADAEENRQAILEAAWRQFSAHGPEASLRSVAADAGVGVATLYRHFASREELLLGVVQEVHERVVALTRARLATWREDPARAWAGFVQDFASLRVGTLMAQMAPVAEVTALFGKRTAATRRATLAAIEELLDAARRDGLVSESLTAPRFFAALATISRPLPGPVTDLLPDDMPWMVEVFVRGVGSGSEARAAT